MTAEPFRGARASWFIQLPFSLACCRPGPLHPRAHTDLEALTTREPANPRFPDEDPESGEET